MPELAKRLHHLAEVLLGAPLPLGLRAWDGSEVAGEPYAPVLVVRHRRALRRILYRPGELGLARAWVAGELDIEGDLYLALQNLAGLVWEREPSRHHPAAVPAGAGPGPAGDRAARERLAAAAGLLALAGPGLPPPPPREELRHRSGLRHSRDRDRQAVGHHYDVGNEFYARVLGPTLVYSCAYWGDGADLESAQRAKLDLVCRKLGLREGNRLLDVGCGWGSLVLHAVREYRVRAVGITLSAEQAALARRRIEEAGLADRAEIRVQDYRETADGPYDAIASIGMAEHVGEARYREYARRLHSLLRPGGRLLNHQIARPPVTDERGYRLSPFIDSYVFPDGELSPVGRTVSLLEEAGFEIRDLESLREHYGLTLRAWVRNLEESWEDAVKLAGAPRARIWRLYMAASALAFERAQIGVNQVLAVRTTGSGRSGLPLRPRTWQ
ncbi:SAM-dependent methyltransferase [Streptomyces aidingensis]|uniref:Cyclopropane-fatty-acyl-phospholipid synthase n=1 Tax=Streptomyces aidingensis TaxID=910347 RepID=A0A1I1GX69_9ACTN|nr:cyclopropane-fatty-acyl-phospholipid synthase family protein [Streptomyces aidingensis]SFC13763.1 cyclopropane-fatty-acyl-phospholipid synthase [Streptomyces aidingensis]